MIVAGISFVVVGVLGMLLNRPITSAAHVLLGEDLARLGGYARNPRTGRAASVTVVATLAVLLGLGLAIVGSIRS